MKTRKDLSEFIAPPSDKCFACDHALVLGSDWRMAQTVDGQEVVIGPECFRKIINLNPHPYQPPKGGPRLTIAMEPCRCYECRKENA